MEKAYYQRYEPLFGSWYLREKLGEGSFGQVYRMEREDFGTTYQAALKAITIPKTQSELEEAYGDGMNKEETTAYFRSVVNELVKEFALMAKLKGQSNVVSYEDHIVIEHTDTIGWDILIRMELLTPLPQYAKRERLTRRDIIKLGIDLCKALELCQKFNIIHRDIKPDNIFVSQNGDFKLGDFGIARTVEKTSSGLSKKGTYTYMAPEVYRGEAYGSSVDVYSLGLVMYRMLNENRTPFLPAYPAPVTFSDRESAVAKRMTGTPLPRPVNAQGRLAEIVLKACAYDVQQRYHSPAQMRQDLEAILYNQEEAQIIYPEGDEAPIKSLHYVPQGQTPDKAPLDELTCPEKTALSFAVQQERNVSASGQQNGEDDGETVSPFGDVAQSAGSSKKKRKNHVRFFVIATVVLAVAVAGYFGTKAIVARQTMQQKYESLMAQAQAATQPAQALTALQQAHELRPEQQAPVEQIAYALYENLDFAKCAAYCKEQLDPFSQSINLKTILASAYFELAEYDAAAQLYQELSENAQEQMQIDSLRDYAVCLARTGKLDEAAAVFVLLTDQGANAEVTDYVLGETYYAKKDWTNAAQMFQKLLQETQQPALLRRTYLALAETYRENGDYQGSIETLGRALNQSYMQGNPVLYEMLGLAYYRRAEAEGLSDDYRQAASSFEVAISLGMQKDYLYTNVLVCYQNLGDDSAATETLKTMKETWPSSYLPYALNATQMILQESKKDEASRNYAPAYAEYQQACKLVIAQDDTTQLQQLEGLIQQLKNGGWL